MRNRSSVKFDTTHKSIILSPAALTINNSYQINRTTGLKRLMKNVVFNGTFPIDEPMSSRFYDDEAAEIIGDDDPEAYLHGFYDDDDDDNDDEDEDDPDYENRDPEEYKVQQKQQQLLNDYDRSFIQFDQLIRNRRQQHMQTAYHRSQDA